ncbi:MAG: UpxY family transcription antiterminator [Mucilaginibacter sp.]|uniref:UpxY family transcription antiterminator n=1 Tax=Mucilaginibacter sp. TaxID=1882438 RepID=UPI0031B040EB
MTSFTTTEKSKASKWMVVYTRSRWEKKVDKLLQTQKINSFCPTIKTKHRWVDRTKVVDLPLFTSYLFVNADPKEQLMVRQTMGVVNFVNHCGKPATITDSEIERIKNLINSHENIEAVSMPRIKVGDQLKVENGLLLDWQGEVLKINGKSVVMLMKELNCALVIDTEQTALSKI